MQKLLLTCLILLTGFAVQAQQPTAPEILKKAAGVYSSCRSYSDEGDVTSKISGFAMGMGARHAHFRTAFLKPDRFRFDVNLGGNSPTWVVWKEGDLVRSSGAGVLNGQHSLDRSLSSVGMASFGGSLTIPPMLLHQFVRSADLFSLISNPVVAGEEKVDGKATYRIEGTLFDNPIKIWIDRNQYLILKVYRKTYMISRGEELTIQYKPKLNAEIPPEMLVAPAGPLQVIAPSETPSFTLPPLALPNLRNFGSSLRTAEGAKQVKAAAGGSEDDDVVRVDTDLVVSSVLVVQRDGKIVNGLTKDDFVVKEDDQPQEVASLSRGDNKDVPRSIVLIIDYSGSQLPYIRNSIESAKMLVDKLNPKDRMAIVTDDVQLLVDFTADKELLRKRLESLKASALAGYIGASDQFDAMFATLTELFDGEDVRPIVIFQTDGDELEALKGNPAPVPFWLPRKFSFQDILNASEKARATIYPVISGIRYVGVPDTQLSDRALIDWQNRQAANLEMMKARGLPLPKENPVGPSTELLQRYAGQWLGRQKALVQMAKFTGAWPEFLEKPGEADEIYTRILTDIDRRYIIGYYPTNRTRDGKRRKVSVEVRGHPEYLVWGQKSYFAREEK